MSNQLGPVQITCDAPPYLVVQACESLGFHTPLDVGWWRLSHFLAEHREQRGVLGRAPWKWFFSPGVSRENACSCGEPLPLLEAYSFIFVSHTVAEYHLGQCSRCHTIFWEEG